MKRTAKFFTAVLAVVFFFSNGITAKAYEHTVTLYPGDVGEFSSEKKAVPNSEGSVTFEISDLKLNDSKYYVKGIRLAGDKTNNDAPYTYIPSDTDTVTIINVDKDLDYVIVYGVAAQKISYEVKYVDQATGEVLAPSSIYTGSAGDQPVATAVYVEGYEPVFDYAVKTLVDGGDNTITFYYNPVATLEVESVTTNVETVTVINRVPGNVVVNPTRPVNPTVPVEDVITPGGNENVEPGTVVDETGDDKKNDGEDPSKPSNGEEKDPTIEVDPEPTPGANKIFGNNAGLLIAGGSIFALLLLFLLFINRRKDA